MQDSNQTFKSLQENTSNNILEKLELKKGSKKIFHQIESSISKEKHRAKNITNSKDSNLPEIKLLLADKRGADIQEEVKKLKIRY